MIQPKNLKAVVVNELTASKFHNSFVDLYV